MTEDHLSEYKNFLKQLNNFNVPYIVIGGFAVVIHGYQRTTNDLDIWIFPRQKNLIGFKKALSSFGIEIDSLSDEVFLQKDKNISIGEPPFKIHLIKQISGADFEDAYQRVRKYNWEDITVNVLDIDDLINIKIKSGRYKDFDDVKNLKEINKKKDSE